MKRKKLSANCADACQKVLTAVASPDAKGWGQRLGDMGETDPRTRFIVAKSRYFHYNLRNSTSRGLEVFRVFHEWFTEAD